MQDSSVPSSPVLSTRPYMIRALHEWIVDNGWTPYILVDARAEDAMIPGAYAQDGRIIFNISTSATKNLYLGNEKVTFSGRFNGVPSPVSVPIDAVLAIYAKENGAGMGVLEEILGERSENGEVTQGISEKEASEKDSETPFQKPSAPKNPSRPVLRVVK
uniref:Stringent starvation protein B n=1 Tax=Candidatus Kentrum sp. SD TaxID=2126332 RepID=A0A450YW96_9GAMM|nr:MAG: stringent starvation protein B [Candidatus Kentron sp. SD]VFK45796.1 MAG: stringent starvation protein B [Candidatus Kentron sp. SD]VFK79780.1 MAG: stringent starvation protein B [Candidatus Kentron sp. SD]